MKMYTFKDCIIDAMKSLKRNITTTITSSIAVSISFSIIGIFLLYLMLIQSNSLLFFEANERYSIDIAKIRKIIRIIVYIVLPLISVIIVGNAIKLSVFCKEKEIRTMKLLGATEWFIRWPFIIEGLVIGIIGGLISTFSLYCIYKIISIEIIKFMPDLHFISSIFIIKNMLIIFEVYGMVIGVIGSVAALRKSLKYI